MSKKETFAEFDGLTSREITVPEEIKTGVVLTVARMRKLGKDDFIHEELYEPAMHLIKNPGKLIRPGLIFTTASMLHKSIDQFIDLAAAIEMLHIASLIHDDIVDKDTRRRGAESVHSKFGVEKAIITGDAIIAKAIEICSQYGGNVVRIASKSALDMCAGEMLDYSRQASKTPLDLHSYIRIAELKTASLMAVASSIVADAVGSGARDTLYEIGFNMGLAFQMRDDITNFIESGSNPKKGVKNDAESWRPNIVSVFQGIGREDPLKSAIKLNNFHVDNAYGLLDKLPDSKHLESYLDFLKIGD